MNKPSSTFWNIVAWLFAFAFAVTGTYFFPIDPVIGFCYLASAIVLLPPLKKICSKKRRIILLAIFLGIVGIKIIWLVMLAFTATRPH